MKYKVTIYTNCKTVEFGTDELCPAVLAEKVDIEQFDGDFITMGKAIDCETGEELYLTDDGYYNFVRKKFEKAGWADKWTSKEKGEK